MDAVVALQSHITSHSKPTVPELAEIKRPCSIDDLIALVRAEEQKIFSHAREREIDPLTLRCRLLLHLPQFVTGDSLPSERVIQREVLQREVLAVSKLIEDSQRPYAHWLKEPESPIALSDLVFGPLDAETARVYHEC